jgi:P4 family phage/plasmid primase-like protien
MSVEELAKAREKKQKQTAGNLPWLKETDRGIKFLPGVLARHLVGNVRSFYAGEAFFLHKAGVYTEVTDDEAAGIVKKYLPDAHCKSAWIGDAMNLWKLDILKTTDVLKQSPFVINLKNGLLDVKTGAFGLHDPALLSVIQLNCNYDAEAGCPSFLKFLNEVLPTENVLLVQELFGYCLVPVTVAQKAFILFGPGQSGKSTILSVLEHLLGGQNISSVEWQDLGDRFKTAQLFGKLANIAADIPARALEDTSVFKTIVGEDSVTAERKFKNPFSFKPFSRLLFSCNKLPFSKDNTNAFYRRLIIIPFSNVIPAERVDKHLKEKLYTEADGILTWALVGLQRLMKNNYTFSENAVTREQTERYKLENSNVLAFIAEHCVINPSCIVKRERLYQEYKKYCEENGFKYASQRNFNREMEVNFSGVCRDFSGPRDMREKVWRGIGLLTDGWNKSAESAENTRGNGVWEETEVF